MDSSRFNASPGSSRGLRSWTPPLVAELQSLLPQYRFLELIGRGERSAVYRAVQTAKERSVAIKVMPTDSVTGNDPGFLERLRFTVKALADLSHPGIAGVYEQGEVGLLLYLVEEPVDGTDLARHVRMHGRVSQSEAVEIAIQICDALECAHERGVVHRDLRPANLLRDASGRVKIVDFGLARGPSGRAMALDAGDYAAPEVSAPGVVVDGRADLYSLGVVLHELLTGEVPRSPWTPPSEAADVDPRFDAILDRALRPNPAERYPTAAEFRRDLKVIERRPLVGVPRRPWWKLPAIVGAIAACLALAVILWRNRGDLATSGTRLVPEFGPSAVEGIEIPDADAAMDPNESTVEFWALPGSAGFGSLFSLGGGTGSGTGTGALSAMAGMLGQAGGGIRWDFGGPASAERLTAPGLPRAMGSWTHFAFVASRARNDMRLYTNGALCASKPGLGRIPASTNRSLWIGRSEEGSMRGSMTEFRVWNRARSEEEIRRDYRRDLKGTEPGLVLYLPLKEGRGTVATNRAAATGPKYNGLLRGAPTWNSKPEPSRARRVELAGTSGSHSTNALASGAGERESNRAESGDGEGAESQTAIDPKAKDGRDPVLLRPREPALTRIDLLGLPTNRVRGAGTRGGGPATNASRGRSQGSGDTVLGERALQLADPAGAGNAIARSRSNTFNVTIGPAALETTGTNLVAVGADALQRNRGGNGTVAVGSEALPQVRESSGNTAVGSKALAAMQRGSGNLSVGAKSGEGLSEGNDNVHLGATGMSLGDLAVEDRRIRLGELGGRHRALFLGGVPAVEAAGLDRSTDPLLLGIREDRKVVRIQDWGSPKSGVPLLIDDSGHLGRAPKPDRLAGTGSEGFTYPPGAYALFLEGSAPPAGYRRLGVVEPDRLGTFTPVNPKAPPVRFELFVKE